MMGFGGFFSFFLRPQRFLLKSSGFFWIFNGLFCVRSDCCLKVQGLPAFWGVRSDFSRIVWHGMVRYGMAWHAYIHQEQSRWVYPPGGGGRGIPPGLRPRTPPQFLGSKSCTCWVPRAVPPVGDYIILIYCCIYCIYIYITVL